MVWSSRPERPPRMRIVYCWSKRCQLVIMFGETLREIRVFGWYRVEGMFRKSKESTIKLTSGSEGVAL